ncbi:MAG: cupin domain-containing protein [Candidatus Zixiibacteriota bacterium]
MLIRKLQNCEKIIAGDRTFLSELMHPERSYNFHGRYSLAQAKVLPGKASIKHKLKTDEVYYILSGTGEIHINEEKATVEPGDVIDIPPNSVQWIRNTGDTDLVFLCIVDPAWKASDEEILE